MLFPVFMCEDIEALKVSDRHNVYAVLAVKGWGRGWGEGREPWTDGLMGGTWSHHGSWACQHSPLLSLSPPAFPSPLPCFAAFLLFSFLVLLQNLQTDG